MSHKLCLIEKKNTYPVNGSEFLEDYTKDFSVKYMQTIMP